MNTEDLAKETRGKSNIWAWDDLIRFQLSVAERWLERGNEIQDVFAKFFFYFAGFNALYFLWKKIDNLKQANEAKQIENLLKKLGETKSQEILDKIRNRCEYFCQRPPIERMDRRTINNSHHGDETEGLEWKSVLQDTSRTASERIVAIGYILYLVRSNLFHGSKTASGDDRKIVESSIEPLKILLEETTTWTKQQCAWDE